MSDHNPNKFHPYQPRPQGVRNPGLNSPIMFRPPSPWAPSPPILTSGPRFPDRGVSQSPLTLRSMNASPMGFPDQRGTRGPALQHPRPRWPSPQAPQPFQPFSNHDQRAMTPTFEFSGPAPYRPPAPVHSASVPPPDRQSPYHLNYQQSSFGLASPVPREFETYAYQEAPPEPPPPKSYIIYDDEEEQGPSTAEIIANQSQDYVDEKLLQYQCTIMQLQDEQERVQKKTFVNWINSYLMKRVPPLRVDDLIHDLKDGTKLLALLEVLSGEKLPVEKGRVLRRPHFLSNANTALQFLASKRIKLVNINPADLVDGRPPVVLGLIWTIILYFQIEEHSRNLEYLNQGYSGSVSSLDSASASATPTTDNKAEKWKQGARKTLLQWVTNALPKEVQVKDFGSSWRDGVAFLALIDAIKANLINIAEMKKQSNKDRLQTAFDVAESKLGIARLLDPEDVDVDKPDEKSIMTYVAQFLHKYPEPRKQPQFETTQTEYNNLIKWLEERTNHFDVLIQTNRLPADFNSYLSEDYENRSKIPSYTKLLALARARNIVGIPFNGDEILENLWEKLQTQMLYWLWSLDANLPGNLRIVGKWLSDAEKLLMANDIPTEMNEETASIISRKLEEHKQFFAEMPNIIDLFTQTKNTIKDSSINKQQIVNMEQRLADIVPKAAQRRIHLKFLEHKCCLIAFLNLVESKLRNWSAKFGRLDKVQQLLDQYVNFVSKNKIFQEFGKAFVDMQQVVEEYRKEGHISKKEELEIGKFMRDTEVRWNGLSRELKCAQNMLEEVIANWKRWNLLYSEFLPWLDEAEKHVTSEDEDERLDFFKDVSVWRDKFQLLSDTGNFLISTCDDSVAKELRQDLGNLTHRFERLFHQSEQYAHAGDILKQRKQFKTGLETLCNWLRNAEQILQNPNLGTIAQIQQFGQDVQKLQSEIDDIEEVFKEVSRVFQGLIQEMSRDDVDKNMNILKREKEALVKVRALIPTRLHLYHQLLVQHESLESGQKEIHDWLNGAENLMSELSLKGGPEQINDRLNKHRFFFSKTLYYKSMLESKNKVFQNLLKFINTENNIDFSEVENNMKRLNDRFGYVADSAQKWETNLTNALRNWQTYNECDRKVQDVINQAQYYLNENAPLDIEQALVKQNLFFENLNDNWMHALEKSVQELLKYVPNEEQEPIIKNLEDVQDKWNDIVSNIPVHLINMEYHLAEKNFNHEMIIMENQILQEQNALLSNENIDGILNNYLEYFKNPANVGKVENSLERMNILSHKYNEVCPEGENLCQKTDQARTRWENLQRRIDELGVTLNKIPEQWDHYRRNFQDMVEWMNMVDQSLGSITTEVESMEEFEKERIIFQKICQEADAKRENMKWLVKTLDSLLPYANEAESSAEQKKLEMLIARYKNLIPTIEVTMVRTEVFSKCYTYRREVREIVSLLNKVRDQTLAAPPPESLAHVTKMVQEQQYAMAQLDQQRPNIVSMLQRGKDLSTDTHAPAFMVAEVKSLESGWKDTYNQSADKLKTLKDTQQVWTDYTEQRNEIITMIGRAETELRSITPLQTDPQNVMSDLKAKKELNTSLKSTSQPLIEKLKELSQSLIPLTASEKQPAIAKDVVDIEKQFVNTIDHVQNRVEYLQDYSQRWDNYKARLAELQAWASQTAPTLVESLTSSDLTPDEKKAKCISIQRIITDKMRQLDMLSNEAIELAPKEGNLGEAKRLKAEVGKLKEVFSAVNKDFEHKAHEIQQLNTDWQKYQVELREIKPQVENLEIKLNVSAVKPASLQEAVQLQQQALVTENECQAHVAKLHNMAQIGSTLSTQANVPDELDSITTRYNAILENTKQSKTKIDKLVANWQVFDSDATKLEQWIIDNEKILQKRPNILMTPQIDKLEKELAKLKSLNNEISEHQAKLIGLSQNTDTVILSIAPEGGAAIKERIQQMKTRILQMSDDVRDKINSVMDAIMNRQDFNAKIIDFSNWVSQVQTKSIATDEILEDKIPYNAQLVHGLLQESAEKKPVFNEIYNDVKDMVLNASAEEANALNEFYTTLVSSYQELDAKLERKRLALDKWAEVLNWANETNNHVTHLQQQIDSSEQDTPKLEGILQELANIQSIITEKNAAPVPELSDVQVRDKTGRGYLSYPRLLIDLENRLESLRAKTVNLLDTSQKQVQQKDKHAALEKSFVKGIQDIRQKLEVMDSEPLTITNIEDNLNNLLALSEMVKQQAPLRDNLRQSGNFLINSNLTESRPIQESIFAIDRDWENLGAEINKRIENYQAIQQALIEYEEAKAKFGKEFQKAKDIYQGLPLASVGEEPTFHSTELSKKCLESTKKCKVDLDDMAKKGKKLAKTFEVAQQPEPITISEEVNQAQEQYQELFNNLQKLVQSNETEGSLWRQIEILKEDLLPWLEDTNKNLCEASENVMELENSAIRINKYKNELPHYITVRNDIAEKTNQLQQLKNTGMPALVQAVEQIDNKFKTIETNAKHLEALADSLNAQEKEIRACMKLSGEKINKIREALIKCDDMSGEPPKIIDRIKLCSALMHELDGYGQEINTLNARILELEQKHPALADSIIPKEVANVIKRHENVTLTGKKIQDTLSQFLRKLHVDRLESLKRLVDTQKEKLQWCKPELGSDKYNLDVKKNSLNDVKQSIVEIDNRNKEFAASLKLLEEIPQDASISGVLNDHKLLTASLEAVKQTCATVEDTLKDNIGAWEVYDNQNEKLNAIIKVVEHAIREDCPVQMDVSQVPQIAQKIQGHEEQLQNVEILLKDVEEQANLLNAMNPDARPLQYYTHLTQKAANLKKQIDNQQKKNNEINSLREKYNDDLEKCRSFLTTTNEKLNAIILPKKSNLQKLEEIKPLLAELFEGSRLVDNLTTDGESLCAVLIPANRDVIRNECKDIRDQIENLFEKANKTFQTLEAALVEKTSLEDNIVQINKWLEESNSKVPDTIELGANANEKKAILQKYKVNAQDVALQKQTVVQLKNKVRNYSDIELNNKVQDALNEYDQLEALVNTKIDVYKDHVDNHDKYDGMIESVADWLNSLKSETADILSGDTNFNKALTEERKRAIERILSQEKIGDKLLEGCDAQLKNILPETDVTGHPALEVHLADLRHAKDEFFNMLRNEVAKITNNLDKLGHIVGAIDEYDKWTKNFENALRDQSLKNSLEAKEAHLNNLKKLGTELDDKAVKIAETIDELSEFDVEPEVNLKCSKLNTRCLTMKNLCKDLINKYETYTKDHGDFNEEYAGFKDKLKQAVEKLKANSEIVGDLGVLQQRYNIIKELADQRILDSTQYENLLEKGEKLYTQTSPDGREVIRQDLDQIKTVWENYTDDLNNMMQKLDQCMSQFGEFTMTQEQLTKWLKEVEKSMQNHMELKATIQEKKAQLQNHKLMHQEILSHQPLVENYCEKAKQFVSQTNDNSLDFYFQSIENLYKNIVSKSDELLKNLEQTVQTHSNLNNLCSQFKSYLSNEEDSTFELESFGADKAEINRKLNLINQLQNNLPRGEALLKEIKDNSETVEKTSSPEGQKIIQNEIAELEKAFNNHKQKLDSGKTSLTDILAKWKDFDTKLEEITQWCRAKETIFKGENLQPTLQAKQDKLKEFIENRNEIIEKQKIFDDFVDNANQLQIISGTEKVRNLTSQINNRYQLLQILSKEVINRWTNLVDDHEKYDNTFKNTTTLVEQIENKVAALDRQNVQADINKLITDQDYIEKVLSNTNTLGEKILPDTLAQGREQIRKDLRDLQERWERIQGTIDEMKKQQDNIVLQLSNYQDMIQQISTWLDAVEKNVEKEVAIPYTTMQDIRAKTIKMKSILQDINSRKRIIDMAAEKADQIIQTPSTTNGEEIQIELDEIKERFQKVLDTSTKYMDQLNNASDVYDQFYELQKIQQDNQKQLWDTLTTCSDTSGNSAVLQKRLEKLDQVGEVIEGEQPTLISLQNHVESNAAVISPRSKENMTRDIANMKSDCDKFAHALADAKNSLKNKLEQWKQFDTNLEQLIEQISDAEIKLKNYVLKSSLAEKQEQLNEYKELALALKQQEFALQNIQEESSNLIQSSGDLRMSLNVQQVVSRSQAIHSTAKEILKKCEQAVQDHEAFNDKYKQCCEWLTNAQKQYAELADFSKAGSQDDFQTKYNAVQELLLQSSHASLLVNNVFEAGEKIHPSTAVEGREVIREQQQELQTAVDKFFDDLSELSRSLQNKLSKWSGFDDICERLDTSLKPLESQLPEKMILKASLEEKRHMLQHCRDISAAINSNKPQILELKEIVDGLPEENSNITSQYNNLDKRFTDLLNLSNKYIESYIGFVNDHQQHAKDVASSQDFVNAALANIEVLGDSDVDRVTLKGNLERLRSAQQEYNSEAQNVEEIRQMAEKVLNGTHEDGKANIRADVDQTQQDWEKLLNTLQNVIAIIDSKLQQWEEFEKIRDDCINWITNVDRNLHSIDLKSTKDEKVKQLENLKDLQGEIRAKELEVDNVTEKSQALQKGSVRSSQISDFVAKYQQVCAKVKDLTSRWQTYVSNHQDYEKKLGDCNTWIQEIKDKLDYCSDLNPKDLENKMATIQNLLLLKDEGFGKIQNVNECAQHVLANTAPVGHDIINKELAKLQEDWSNLAMKMIETKQLLDDSLNSWSVFMDQVKDIEKQLDWMDNSFKELSAFQTTMPEKRNMLEKIKTVVEKIRVEKMDVDILKKNASDLSSSDQQSQSGQEAIQILNKFDNLSNAFEKLLMERESQYRDHRLYQEAFDDLTAWLGRAKDKFPSLKQQLLGDKLTIDNCVAPLDALLNKQPQGELMVEHLIHTSEVVIPSTSEVGQEGIKKEIGELKKSFDDFFRDIQLQKDQMDVTVVQWREFKDEFDRLSEWLQQIDILVKNHKLNLQPTLNDKQKQVTDMKSVLQRLENGRADFDRLNVSTAPLLATHLESYIANQLNQLNSKYQVQLNLAKDVFAKVENNYEQHKEFEENYKNAKNWIETAKEALRNAGDASGSGRKDILEKCLQEIQNIIRNRDEGQNLVHMTVNNGEKILRNTRSDGKEQINNQIKEVQSEWDRLVKKMSTAKVNLETSLLQWADYSSSYDQLQKWITEREAKLQEVVEQKVEKSKKGQPLASGLNERKANLRQTNNIVQDIVSFEPMIQSVTSKASDLQQAVPASEITEKYVTLSKHAKDVYEKQKETIANHQALIDAGTDFAQWLRNAKERLSKCIEPTGDKDTLTGKLNQLRILKNELESDGKTKLNKVLEQGEIACRNAVPTDREIIEEEVALLQEEFDHFADKVENAKDKLESAILQWGEYDKKYQEAEEWLTKTEALVQSYNKLQDSLEEKKNVLEQFQNHLQTIFDWQAELDQLNMTAQRLLETCADTRISNGITQLTTKYNALLSIAKEVMRRLELHYQEHQQHQSLYSECQDWIEDIRHKLNDCNIPNSVTEVKIKLSTVKSIKQMLEQGQNKLRYTIELKEKVIMNTEANGAAKIQEDTENLKQEFEKLSADIADIKQRLTDRLSQLDDVDKLIKILNEYLSEIEPNLQTVEQNLTLNDLSEKRTRLEKYKTYLNELMSYNDTVEKVKQKLNEDNSLDKNIFQTCLLRYETCKNIVTNNIESLDSLVMNHEKYKQALLEIQEWIRNTKINVQQNCDPHGSREELLENQHKLQKIELSQPEGKILLENTIVLSTMVLTTTGHEGQDTINNEIKQLKSDWDGLQMIIKHASDSLNNCVKTWNSFNSKVEETKKWLTDFEKQVADINANPQKWESDLTGCKRLLEAIQNRKNDIEELSDICEVLMEQSAFTGVRDQTTELQERYSKLLAVAQMFLMKAEKRQAEQTNFLLYKEQLENWIKEKSQMVVDNSEIGNESVLRTNLETLNAIFNRLPEGQSLFIIVQDAFEKTKPNLPDMDRLNIEGDMEKLQAHWDQLGTDVSDAIAKLKNALLKLEGYNDTKQKFGKWLTEKEAQVEAPLENRGDLSEMKTILERFKSIKQEVDNKKPELAQIVEEAKDISEWSKSHAEIETTKEYQARHDKLGNKCDEVLQRIQMEIEDHSAYNHKLQEVEKWLLQVSFQLMAHNSLYICNREQTEEQLAQHELLLNDIQKYQVNLDDLRSKGNNQILRYENCNPYIRNTIETHLKNVQDSYNSLLATSVQIKNRLEDSLIKFKEYEDTIDDIEKKLVEYQQQIPQPEDDKPSELDLCKNQIEFAKTMANNLQKEKQRLAAAVQACESATASISRPSSPIEMAMQPIPEKELKVRAQLEDLIDQVQVYLDELNATARELETLQKQREELNDWIARQQVIVSDWLTKPSKLRPEAGKQDLLAMNDLLSGIGDKRNQLLTELSNSLTEDDENNKIEEQLDKLEDDLMKAMHKVKTDQSLIELYRQALQDNHQWVDDIIKQLDHLDSGSNTTCDQKIETMKTIQKSFETQQPGKLNELNEAKAKVVEVINNLDGQQVEEQVKGIERRFNDVGKRIARKMQTLDSTHKGLKNLKDDIKNVHDWIKENTETVLSTIKNSQPNDNQLNYYKDLLKKAEEKLLISDTLEKRLANLQTELEPVEVMQIQNEIQITKVDGQKLREMLKSEIGSCTKYLQSRKKFNENLEKAQEKLSEQKADLGQIPSSIPLPTAKVENEILNIKKQETSLQQLKDQVINEITNQFEQFSGSCNETEKDEIQKELDKLNNGFEESNGLVQGRITRLLDSLPPRKKYEESTKVITTWLTEAEEKLSNPIRTTNLPTMEEQLRKYQALDSECREMGDLCTKVGDIVDNEIKPTLTNTDQEFVTNEIKSIKNRFRKAEDLIRNRLQYLDKYIKDYKEAKAKITDCMQFMGLIQAEIKNLNRPIGNKIEDVQDMLKAYDKILNDLKNSKEKMMEIQIENMPELQSILMQQDDMINLVENKLGKLKQLLLLREQFIGLINEILNFITKYSNVVDEVEKSNDSAENKIQKLDDVLSKIQECEALLATAADKGNKIASEGSAADRNQITEQLHSIKIQLQNLRKQIDQQKQKLENTMHEHRKMMEDLSKLIDELHEYESQVKSRPQLNRDPNLVEREIAQFANTKKKIQRNLAEVEKINLQVQSDNFLPGALTEMLSEGRLLLQSLPKEMEDLETYLKNNKQYRLDFITLQSNIQSWIDDSKAKLHNKDGVDLTNIAEEIQKNKTVFGSTTKVKDDLQNLQKEADKIYPSLTQFDQRRLSEELNELKRNVDNIFEEADKLKTELEGHQKQYKQFLELFNNLNEFLNRSKLFENEPVENFGGLNYIQQQINQVFNEVQQKTPDYNTLNEIATTLKRIADADSLQEIETKQQQINNAWNNLAINLKRQKSIYENLISKWTAFNQSTAGIESELANFDDQQNRIDKVVRSRQQLQEKETQIQDLVARVEDFGKRKVDSIVELADNLNDLLTEIRSPSQAVQDTTKAILEKHNQLKDRLKEKARKNKQDLALLKDQTEKLTSYQAHLTQLKEKITNLYVFDANVEKVEHQLKEIKDNVSEKEATVKPFIKDVRERYNNDQNFIPTDLAQELIVLELLLENVVEALGDKMKSFKKARTIRSDYLTNVDEINNWIRVAVEKTNDPNVDPNQFKDNLQKLNQEYHLVLDRLTNAKKCGETIIANSHSDEEKLLIKTTIDQLENQLTEIGNLLSDKRQQIENTLDGWSRFLQLHKAVMDWCREKRILLSENLDITTLQQAKVKHADYSAAVKSVKPINKNLSEMDKELDEITKVTAVAELRLKLQEAEETKIDVESKLLERNSLLMETSEEWEQCEKKMKDVKSWMEKTKSNLDPANQKKKPLRDQLGINEKTLTDIATQKTKINMSIEKLQVHFRSGIGGDTKIINQSREITQQLDELGKLIKDRSRQLEEALSQIDVYQQNIQSLRQKIIQEEQKLRVILSPTYMTQDRDRAAMEEQSSRECIKSLQIKLGARQERIKQLIQRGTPDTEMLLDT